jgi:hypothetical protein
MAEVAKIFTVKVLLLTFLIASTTAHAAEEAAEASSVSNGSTSSSGTKSSGGGFGGYFEIFANGSWYRYNNGVIGGDPSTTTITNYGGGLAYRLLSNTALELSYQESLTKDKYTQDFPELAQKIRIVRDTKAQIISLNLILELSDRKTNFRPYIKGGGGYMIRKAKFSGVAIDRITNTEQPLSPNDPPPSTSVSAQGGLGFKLFVADRLAIEFSGTSYWTDLDKDLIYVHYSVAGGFRYLF